MAERRKLKDGWMTHAHRFCRHAVYSRLLGEIRHPKLLWRRQTCAKILHSSRVQFLPTKHRSGISIVYDNGGQNFLRCLFHNAQDAPRVVRQSPPQKASFVGTIRGGRRWSCAGGAEEVERICWAVVSVCISPSLKHLTINIGESLLSWPSFSCFGCQFNLDLMPPWETPRPISPPFPSFDSPGRARQRHKTSRRNARTVKCLWWERRRGIASEGVRTFIVILFPSKGTFQCKIISKVTSKSSPKPLD